MNTSPSRREKTWRRGWSGSMWTAPKTTWAPSRPTPAPSTRASTACSGARPSPESAGPWTESPSSGRWSTAETAAEPHDRRPAVQSAAGPGRHRHGRIPRRGRQQPRDHRRVRRETAHAHPGPGGRRAGGPGLGGQHHLLPGRERRGLQHLAPGRTLSGPASWSPRSRKSRTWKGRTRCWTS